MKRLKYSIFPGLIFGLLGFSAVQAEAPDLVINDLQGKSVPISKYVGKGKWTVVMLWAHNCPTCNQEVQSMSFFHDDHKDKDATVLGVSVDGSARLAKARGFVDNHGLDFPNLIIEPEQAQIQKFGGGPFVGTPTFYVYSPEGKLEAKHVGPINTDDLEKFIASHSKTKLSKK